MKRAASAPEPQHPAYVTPQKRQKVSDTSPEPASPGHRMPPLPPTTPAAAKIAATPSSRDMPPPAPQPPVDTIRADLNDAVGPTTLSVPLATAPGGEAASNFAFAPVIARNIFNKLADSTSIKLIYATDAC